MNPLIDQTPRFESPQPTSAQRLLMRFAGRIATGGDPDDPTKTLNALVVNAGGFERLGDSAHADQSPDDYRHSGAVTRMVSLAQDETTRAGVGFAPKTAGDHSDMRGKTTRDDAIARTLDGSRRKNSGAKKRDILAARLAGMATKGVGHYPYDKK